MAFGPNNKIVIWVVTPSGMTLARKIQSQWPGLIIRCSERLCDVAPSAAIRPFDALTGSVAEDFHQFHGHIFIMATGIVVRAIAPWLKHKLVDPAVVVVDDKGRHAISLLAGHIGGANALAADVAELLGATAVITTATDVNAKPAIDLIAMQKGLMIENPECIKAVNMALLTETKIQVHDPYALLTEHLGQISYDDISHDISLIDGESTGVYVDDMGVPSLPRLLILRPPSLVAGIGCNRGTNQEEIRELLEKVCEKFDISPNSFTKIASIDVKRDEPGLLALGEALQLPIRFYSSEELNQVRHVPNPSALVTKHVGVQSVCEAAAILAADRGSLIVPKQKTKNATLAISRHSSMLSASALEV